MPIIQTEARRLYQCDSCGRTDVWSEGWAWYGSYRDIDEHDSAVPQVMTICSSECRVALVAAGKLPADGLADNGDVDDDAEDPPIRRKVRRPV